MRWSVRANWACLEGVRARAAKGISLAYIGGFGPSTDVEILLLAGSLQAQHPSTWVQLRHQTGDQTALKCIRFTQLTFPTAVRTADSVKAAPTRPHRPEYEHQQ